MGVENFQAVVSERFSGLQKKICDQAKLESEHNSRLKKILNSMTINGIIVIVCIVHVYMS